MRPAEAEIRPSTTRDPSSPPARIGRRRFIELAGQAWLTIPVVSWLIVGCGSDSEERASTDGEGDAGSRGDEAAREGQATGSKQRAKVDEQAQEEPSGASAQEAAQAPSSDSAPAAEDTLITEIPGMAGLVKTVNYQHESPQSDQRCANCELYTKKTDERGSCKLFAEGLVEAGGWCTSWIKKANAV
jgi:hypothetical protein